MTEQINSVSSENIIQVDNSKPQFEILNARDVANYLRIGYTKALSLMKHELPSLKFGNTYRINRYSLEDWLKKREVNKPATIN